MSHSAVSAFDVAVIGAGLGGTSVALALARRGCSVALIEAGKTRVTKSAASSFRPKAWRPSRAWA